MITAHGLCLHERGLALAQPAALHTPASVVIAIYQAVAPFAAHSSAQHRYPLPGRQASKNVIGHCRPAS